MPCSHHTGRSRGKAAPCFAACRESRRGARKCRELSRFWFTEMWFQQVCNKYMGTSSLLEFVFTFAFSILSSWSLAFRSSKPSCSVTVVLNSCMAMPPSIARGASSTPAKTHGGAGASEVPHVLLQCKTNLLSSQLSHHLGIRGAPPALQLPAPCSSNR